MPVEAVQLMEREQVDVFLDEFLRHERARHVEMRAAPWEARHVLDLDRRHGPDNPGDRGRAKDVRRQQLPQRLDTVEHTRGTKRANRDARARDGKAISLLAQPRQGRIEAERYGPRGRSGCAAHREAVPSRRLQPIAELVADLTRGAVGDDNGCRREQEYPGAAGQLRGPGNDGKRGVLDTGGEDEQREEVDHADRISLAETFGER